MMLDYAICATLGPASRDERLWARMVSAGATAFRLNTSHLTLDDLLAWLDQLEPFLAKLEPRPSLVLDLQGSKWRLGDFNPFELTAGEKVELIQAQTSDQLAVLPVPHPDFFMAAPISSPQVVLNDARIRLRVEALFPDRVEARVELGGLISPRKGITFTQSNYRQESLSPKDQAIVAQTWGYQGLKFAVSYIKDGVEAAKYRLLLGREAYLIAKLEREPALTDVLKIAAVSNEMWVCRGDLGAELGLKSMAEAVYLFSETIGQFSIPVVMAGQVLEHMTEHSTPTRSEIAYIHQVLMKGYRGLVLSDETAIGINPEESCRMAALFKRP